MFHKHFLVRFNFSAVFAPACLSHEILTRTDWFNVTVNGVQLGQSIYCWENSHRYEKCVMNSNSQSKYVQKWILSMIPFLSAITKTCPYDIQ